MRAGVIPRPVSFSHCPTVTSAVFMLMVRPDCVVPAWRQRARLQPHPGLVFWCRPLSRWVVLPIQVGAAPKAGLRSRRANVLENGCVAYQGLARPVGADGAEHPVF